MEVKEERGLRVNYLIIFLSGLVLLISGILVFLLIVKNIYGNYEIKDILPTAKNIKLYSEKSNQKIAILYSKYTENMLQPPGSTWLSNNVNDWKKAVKNAKLDFEIISDQTIELGKHYNYKVIILPGSKSLSDKELMHLKRYIENGGSILATGGPATYSDEGKWRGWDFFKEVFGMNFNREVKPEETYKVHTLRGNLSLTSGIPTGFALKIATYDRPIYAEVLEPRTTQVSFWYDFRKEAGLVREEIQKSAGIAFGTYGKGRFVWFGFELSSVQGVEKDYINFEKLYNNSINWLMYNPTAFVKDWPSEYQAALLLVPTLTEQSSNIHNISSTYANQRLQTTYFMDVNKAIKNPGLVKSLANKGEIGVILDIGFLEFPEDTVNKLYKKEVQFSSLKFAADTLGKISGKKIKALMPLNGYYDDNTLLAMAALDYQFLLTDSLTDRSVPEMRFRNGKPIMVITKTARDDYEIVKNYGLINHEYQRYTYEEDVDRILFEGGLYVFKVHTDYQLQPQYSSVINEVIKYAASKKVWITTLDELELWWNRKQNIEIRYETRSIRRIAVELTNPKDTKTEELVIQVNLNKKVKNVQVSSDMINTKIPKYSLSSDNQVLFFYIDKMESKETRSLIVDFENIDR